MTDTSKIVGIVVVVVLVIAGGWWYFASQGQAGTNAMPYGQAGTQAGAQEPSSVANGGSASDVTPAQGSSDAALDQDSAQINAQLQGLNSDNSSFDNGVNNQ
jgi:hypothetical protein